MSNHPPPSSGNRVIAVTVLRGHGTRIKAARGAGSLGCVGRALSRAALFLVLSAATPFSWGRDAGLQSVSTLCEFEAPLLDTANGYARAAISGCEPWHRAGEPVLPFRTVRLLLPPASEVLDVSAQTEAESLELPGFWSLEFSSEPVPSTGATVPAYPGITNPGWQISPPDALYPSASVELASVQRMKGYDVAFVRVYPLRYNLWRGQLIFTPRLRVAVALVSQPVGAAGGQYVPGVAAAGQAVATMVENPEMIAAYNSPAIQAGGNPTVDYLLVTKSNLVVAFQPLVDQKALDGLSVKVETMENIAAGYPGRDGAEKLRNYIRYAYTNWGITYVLLGGDSSTVPCRYAYAYMSSLAPDSLVPSDLYYACLDGSWDQNGNGIFGEPGDGVGGGEVDLLAEVYVGRAPVDTASEASLFVQKTLQYETGAHPHADRALFMAEYLGSTATGPSQGWDMFVPLLPFFGNYQISQLDDSPFTSSQWTPADAIRELNLSPHLALFNGHGDIDLMMRLYSSDLDALTNPSPFLVYSVGCNAGQFDNDKFSPDCIGEELVKRNSRGAFAAILNSRLGWYDPQNEWKWSGEFQIKFFDELLTKGITRLGVANQLSKHDMVSRVETSGLMTYRWCYFEITLFGDPHQAWKTSSPAPTLVIASAHGGASPPAGTNFQANGAVLACTVTNSPVSGGPGLRYLCTGWSGSGSVGAGGAGTQVSFIITNDSRLTWTWSTQTWFAASTSGNGTINTTNGWRDLGAGLSIKANPSAYHHFVKWTGDVPTGQEYNSTLNLSMDRPRTVAAAFAPNLTSQGTPEWWLAGYGWTNNFESVAAADPDADGAPNWQEYIAGTSPTDSGSALRLAAVGASGPGAAGILKWPSVAGRVYSLRAAEAPGGPFSVLTNGIPATPPLNIFPDRTGAPPMRFYRVEVNLAP